MPEKPLVVVVDDNKDFLRTTYENLAGHFDMRMFTDSSKALKFFGSTDKNIAAFLFDQNLGSKINGTDLAQIVRGDNRFSGAPVFIVTGYPKPPLEQACDSNITDIIKKPVNYDKLINELYHSIITFPGKPSVMEKEFFIDCIGNLNLYEVVFHGIIDPFNKMNFSAEDNKLIIKGIQGSLDKGKETMSSVVPDLLFGIIGRDYKAKIKAETEITNRMEYLDFMVNNIHTEILKAHREKGNVRLHDTLRVDSFISDMKRRGKLPKEKRALYSNMFATYQKDQLFMHGYSILPDAHDVFAVFVREKRLDRIVDKIARRVSEKEADLTLYKEKDPEAKEIKRDVIYRYSLGKDCIGARIVYYGEDSLPGRFGKVLSYLTRQQPCPSGLSYTVQDVDYHRLNFAGKSTTPRITILAGADQIPVEIQVSTLDELAESEVIGSARTNPHSIHEIRSQTYPHKNWTPEQRKHFDARYKEIRLDAKHKLAPLYNPR